MGDDERLISYFAGSHREAEDPVRRRVEQGSRDLVGDSKPNYHL